VAKLLEFETASGPVVIAIGSTQDIGAAGGLDGALEKTERSFEGALRMIEAVANSLASTLARTSADSAQVEFGLQFTGKGTLFVVESEAQASLKVTLSFKVAAAT
jgi:hypothetical protein